MLALRWDVRLTDRVVIKAIFQLKTPTSQRQIAESLGCTDRTIKRSLRRLKAAGAVTVVSGGSYYPSTYKVHLETLPDELRRELESGIR